MSIEYNPNGLLDAAIQMLRLKNDAALARALEIKPPLISKIRHNRLPVGDSMIVRLIEAGMSMSDIRSFVPR